MATEGAETKSLGQEWRRDRKQNRLTTNVADRGGGVGEAHVLKAGVGIVSVNVGRVHQFWGLAVFKSEMLEGGLHCRLQMRV